MIQAARGSAASRWKGTTRHLAPFPTMFRPHTMVATGLEFAYLQPILPVARFGYISEGCGRLLLVAGRENSV